MKEEKDNENPRTGLLVGSIAAFLVIIVCAWAWCYRTGDEGVYTMLQAVFSGLAFVGLIVAIFMQREEIKLQRRDIEETKEALQKSAVAQDKSQEALTSQIAVMSKTALLSGHTAKLQYHDTQSKYSANLGDHAASANHSQEAKHNSERIAQLLKDIEAEMRKGT